MIDESDLRGIKRVQKQRDVAKLSGVAGHSLARWPNESNALSNWLKASTYDAAVFWQSLRRIRVNGVGYAFRTRGFLDLVWYA